VDHRELLRMVRKRPGMYLGTGDLDFRRLIAFLAGLDLGAGLLDGFREYLILRLGERSSLWWASLALRLTVPHASPMPAGEDDDRAAVDGLFDLLDEFLAEFPVGRRRRLFEEYLLWSQQQDNFELDLERFRGHPRPELIGVEEAATLLGTTRAALFDLVAAGEIELFRDGPAPLIRKARVTELLARRPAQP
jgi:excisionase family DNA binding protein